ncbi:Flp family type IVb pilin [Thalassotalea nanhaiensis]|uniref:Flp family type IVb pilin n=1 Tax=Thalassotalea nanhaiensis TaxID=3065648 RepID=A0ABY9TG41_9GAMM|nr:Flp family type IVb pilin [Colwelliaceae bacterium SQ345]
MRNLKNLFSEFIEDESGLTAVEYAVAGALVVGSMVVAFDQLGTSAENKITAICNAVDADNSGECN